MVESGSKLGPVVWSQVWQEHFSLQSRPCLYRIGLNILGGVMTKIHIRKGLTGYKADIINNVLKCPGLIM